MNNKDKISSDTVDPQNWVDEYRDSLFSYALDQLRDADLAKESIQETFLAALQSRKNFRGLSSEKTWLFSILKRKIYDHFRKINRNRQFFVTSTTAYLRSDFFDNKRMPAASSLIWLLDPSMIYEQKEFLKIITNSLSELPGRLALVFILRVVVDMSSQEICEFLDINICNFYVMIHRARKRLRYFLQLKWFF